VGILAAAAALVLALLLDSRLGSAGEPIAASATTPVELASEPASPEGGRAASASEPSAPAPATSEPSGPAPAKPPRDDEVEEMLETAAAAPPPLYVPPARAAPAVRVGGGTRAASPELPKLLALTPPHEGFTVSGSPTLYWYLSAASPVPVEFVLTHPGRDDPVLELTLPVPVEPGIHAVALADHGVVLEPETQYRWFVSLVPDPSRRSSDVVSGGAVRRIEPGERLQAELREGGAARAGHVYAKNGLFYDALTSFSGWIDRAPDEPRLRELRAALLAQVGLGEAAGDARSAAEERPAK